MRDLQWLLGRHEPPCVSIYLPGQPRSDAPERFRALINRAATLLLAQYTSDWVGRVLDPVSSLSHEGFWRPDAAGLAIFRSPEALRVYRLPISVPELVVVAQTFHTKPLVGYLTSHRHFFVLALERTGATLFEGSPEALAEIDAESLPPELAEVLAQPLEVDTDLATLARRLGAFLLETEDLLVLAGDTELLRRYRAVSRYPFLLDEGLEGSTRNMSPQALHERVFALVRAHELAVEDELLVQFDSFAAGGRTTDDLREIGRAAVSGRVRVLLHEQGRQIWGHIDPETGGMDIRTAQRDAIDADLVDDLGELVLLRDGEVFELPPDRMPTDSPVAAILRY